MTLIKRTPTRVALSLLLLLSLLFSITPAQRRRAAKPADKKQSAKKQTAKSAKNARADRGRSSRDKSARDSRSARGRSSAREKETARASRDDRKGGRAQSRRERQLEARRDAERRRREAMEAARRREQARQEALARQRAADQALRDEAAANIARDQTTGEDLEIRRIAVAALGNHAGTVVVMNPKTGQVYTVVNQDWALRRGFKPCSTVKLVTGLAGLTEHVIDPASVVNVSSNALDLTDSLAYSNNGYFQNVGGRVGFDRMIQYAKELGLGERTGINYPMESTGRIPVYKTGFAMNRMCSHGDDFEVTPIQLANMVSAIGNGGKLMVPRLPRTPQETFQFKPEVRRKLSIPQENLTRMLPGMIGAVNYGTGKGAYDSMMPAAGKTGTCIGQGSWLGLFGSFAPVVNPKLTVVVVTRGSGERGRIAAAISGKIYRALNGRFGVLSPGGDRLATTPANLQPRPKIDPRAAAAISDEEEGDTVEATGDVLTDTLPSTSGASKTRSVIMTAPTRPTEVTIKPTAPPASGAKQTGTSATEARPRRVLTTQP